MPDIMTIHTANVDTTATKPYNSVLITDIDGFAGYAKQDVRVLGGFKKLSLEGDSKTYVDGEVRGLLYLRHSFDVPVVPFSFHTGHWDLGDLDDLETAIMKILGNKCWIELTQIGERNSISYPYHATGYAIPVELMGLNFEDTEGFKSVTLNFQKRWRES